MTSRSDKADARLVYTAEVYRPLATFQFPDAKKLSRKPRQRFIMTINSVGRASNIEDLLSQLQDYLDPTTAKGAELALCWTTGPRILEAIKQEEDERHQELEAEQKWAKRKAMEAQEPEKELKARKKARVEEASIQAKEYRAWCAQGRRAEAEAKEAQETQEAKEAKEQEEAAIAIFQSYAQQRVLLQAKEEEDVMDDKTELGGRGYDGYAESPNAKPIEEPVPVRRNISPLFMKGYLDGPFMLAEDKNPYSLTREYGHKRQRHLPPISSDGAPGRIYAAHSQGEQVRLPPFREMERWAMSGHDDAMGIEVVYSHSRGGWVEAYKPPTW